MFAKLPFWRESSGTEYITNYFLDETTMVPLKLEHIMWVNIPVRFSRIDLLLEGDI